MSKPHLVAVSNTSKVEIKGPVGILRKRLRELRKQDKQAEGRASFGCTVGCVGLCVGFVLFIRLLILDGDTPSGTFGIACLLTTAVCIAGWIINSHFKGYDLDDDKQKLARHLLKLLAVDLKPSKDCQLTIDFRPQVDPKVVDSSGKFKQTWLTFEGRLLDGGRVWITLTRRGRKDEITKSKGKRTKIRFREILKVDLQLPANRYPHLDQLPASLPKFTAASIGGIPTQSISLQGDVLRAKLVSGLASSSDYRNKKTNDVSSLWTGPNIAQVLLWLFHGAKKVKCQALLGHVR